MRSDCLEAGERDRGDSELGKMAKRRKGVSLEEKRNRLLNIYHESKDVFNLKEIEKLGSKAGIGAFS